MIFLSPLPSDGSLWNVFLQCLANVMADFSLDTMWKYAKQCTYLTLDWTHWQSVPYPNMLSKWKNVSIFRNVISKGIPKFCLYQRPKAFNFFNVPFYCIYAVHIYFFLSRILWLYVYFFLEWKKTRGVVKSYHKTLNEPVKTIRVCVPFFNMSNRVIALLCRGKDKIYENILTFWSAM